MRGKIGKAAFASDTRVCNPVNSNTKEDLIQVNPDIDTDWDKDSIVVTDAMSIVNKMSFAVQQVNARVERAARCSIRAAITTKSGIDNSKQAMKGMRKITLTMTDVADALELLVGHINELCSTLVVINGLTKQVKQTAEKAVDVAPRVQKYKEHSVVIKEIMQLAQQLDGKTDRISGVIDNVLSDAEKFTEAIKCGSKYVEQSYQTANETGMVMEKVMDTIEDTSGQIDKISTSAEDVALLSDQMNKLVEDTIHRMNKSGRIPV